MKIARSDRFVILDTAEFQKNGVQNRNMIRTGNGPQYLTVPVQQRLGTKTMDVQIADQKWQRKHWKAIEQNYAKARYFSTYAPVIETWYLREWGNLCDLNIVILHDLLMMLGISTPVQKASDLPHTEARSTDMLIHICQSTGAREYISGPGGKAYIDEAKFEGAGINLLYEPPMLPRTYPQRYPNLPFAADLSALDILLNCGPSWRTYV
jgi:hypothetical protein